MDIVVLGMNNLWTAYSKKWNCWTSCN